MHTTCSRSNRVPTQSQGLVRCAGDPDSPTRQADPPRVRVPVSMAVQHLAAPLQYAYIEQLCDVLVPGGRGWLQLLLTEADSTDATAHDVDGCDVGRLQKRQQRQQ